MSQSIETLKEKNVPKEEQIRDVMKLVDQQQVCMLTTTHPDGKLVSRAMRLQKRENLDLWYILLSYKLFKANVKVRGGRAFRKDEGSLRKRTREYCVSRQGE